MNRTIFILVTCALALYGCSKHYDSSPKFNSESSIPDSVVYNIIESRGIDSIAFIGDNIEKVIDRLGKPDREESEDLTFFFPDKYYSFTKDGVEFKCNWSGRIKNIVLFCDTGDTTTFHGTGSIWINPSSVYHTFRGKTIKGLKLRNKLTPNEVYNIYGKPSNYYRLGAIDNDTIRSHQPAYIYDLGKWGYSICYPNIGVNFNSYGGLIESIVILHYDQ